MELESLFTSSKWMILKEISRHSQSPLQLAEKLNTSIANISQQLRLLEAAGIVKKQRVPERARGKPRVMFSLVDDFGYLIAATDGFAEKRLLSLSEYHKFVLRVWFVEDSALHEEIMKFYWKIKPNISQIKAIATYGSNLVVFTKKSDVVSKLRKESSALKKLKLLAKTEDEAKKVRATEELHVLYDPEKMLLKKERGD